MLARFYYFPIRGKNLVVDICGDSNTKYNRYSPICMGYYQLDKRRLNYIEMANRICEPLFINKKDYSNVVQSTSQIHEFYSNENGVEMINIYLTFYCGESKLQIYGKDVLISKGCLDNWNTDDETRNLIVSEIERMKSIYEETYAK